MSDTIKQFKQDRTYWQIQHWVEPKHSLNHEGYWFPTNINEDENRDIFNEADALRLFDEAKQCWQPGSLRLIKFVSHTIEHY